jgi:hypothetical protein
MNQAVYEYNFIATATSPGLSEEEFSKLSNDDAGLAIMQGLLPTTIKLANALVTLDNGTWQVVSHNVVAYGSKLLLTFLLRRLATPTTMKP